MEWCGTEERRREARRQRPLVETPDFTSRHGHVDNTCMQTFRDGLVEDSALFGA